MRNTDTNSPERIFVKDYLVGDLDPEEFLHEYLVVDPKKNIYFCLDEDFSSLGYISLYAYREETNQEFNKRQKRIQWDLADKAKYEKRRMEALENQKKQVEEYEKEQFIRLYAKYGATLLDAKSSNVSSEK